MNLKGQQALLESRSDNRRVLTDLAARHRAWMRLRRGIVRTVVHVLLIALCLLMAFPFYYMAIAAFMQTKEIFTLEPRLLPAAWQLDSFRLLFSEVPYLRNMLNSFFMATTQTVGMVLLCSMAGFAFAKSVFPGRHALFLFILATMMLPHQVTLIPMYQLMTWFHWRNTYYGIIVPGMVGAFGIFLMRQYIQSALPDELVDAATIDGCSFAGIYWRICLPVVVPGLTVLALLTFVGSWNSFLWPLLMLDQPRMFTIPIALVTIQSGANMNPIFTTGTIAGAALGTIPLVILFLFAQRFFVAGIMSGAFKG